jgi:hypothetical protein
MQRNNTILQEFKSLVDQDSFDKLPVTQKILVIQKLTEAGTIMRRYTGVK